MLRFRKSKPEVQTGRPKLLIINWPPLQYCTVCDVASNEILRRNRARVPVQVAYLLYIIAYNYEVSYVRRVL
jgi:hypothetical protein